jgi:hypothetical protein
VADLRISNHRRYCFLQYKRGLRFDDGTDPIWDAKRREIAGTDLPATFPAKSLLNRAGYLVLEELQGANQTELMRAGLSASQAVAALAAIG